MAFDPKLGYDPEKDYSQELMNAGLSANRRGELETERQNKINGMYGGVEPTLDGQTQTYTQKYGSTGGDGAYSQLLTMMQQQSAPRATYGGSDWDSILQQLSQQANGMNYNDWTQGDTYQALYNRLSQQGQKSMQDTLGQIASRTGGLASSYAGTAAQQSYNDYMGQLEELARAQYSNERNELMDRVNLAQTMSDRDYQRWRDEQSDAAEANSTAMSALYELLGYRNDRSDLDYQRGQDERSAAQNRIYDYLTNQGGDFANLDADLITQSGYTTSELQAMMDKYKAAQESAAAQQDFENQLAWYKAHKSTGSSKSSSSKTSEKPHMTLAQIEKAIEAGNATDSVIAGYDYYMGDGAYNSIYGGGESGDEPYFNGDYSSLGYDEDEGTISWAGNIYKSEDEAGAAIQALYNAGVVDDDTLDILIEKLKRSGFGVKVKEG